MDKEQIRIISKTFKLIGLDDIKLGALINTLFEIRETKNAIKVLEKETNSSYEIIVDEIIDRLEEDGVTQSESEGGSVSLSAKIHPSVNDKEAFTKWVVSEERYDMLQKRCSAPSVLEHFNLTNKLPDGISTYIKNTLLVRTKSSA